MKVIDGVKQPRRSTIGSCGYDIYCPCDCVIYPDKPVTLDLGVSFEDGDIPDGFFAMLVPRSSTGSKQGLRLRGTVGIIDSDYRDTIRATLLVDTKPQIFFRNDRILQLILVPYGTIRGEIAPTEERKGGIGSTGA